MNKRICSYVVSVCISILLISSTLYSKDVMAWVSACDLDDARIELQKYYGMKEAISIFGLQWWLPDGSGGIEYSEDYDPTDPDVTPPGDEAVEWFRKFADQNNIKLYLCLYNCLDLMGTPTWDWGLAKSAFVNNPTSTINALVSEMERLDLDGIDLDLEGSNVGDDGKTEYISFATNLYNQVHSKNKDLSICTYASDWGSPGTSWWSSLKNCADHIMCMGYQETGHNCGITYSSLASIGGLSSGVLCLGVNANEAGNWPLDNPHDPRYHLNGIAGMSSVGLCIWTCALFGEGQWIEMETWDIVRQISGKTINVDTDNPSPNLISILAFAGNVDDNNSQATVNQTGDELQLTLSQAGSVDDGYWCNAIGTSSNNFSDVKGIKITYTSTKPFTIQLYQEDLDTLGECYREALPAASSSTTKLLSVSTFFQPWWGERNVDLDLSKVDGITLDPELEGMGITNITVTELVAYGKSSWDVTPITVPEKQVSTPGSFTLSMRGNALAFSVPADAVYTLGIYNASGSLVRTLARAPMKQGTYTIDHVLNGLSRGIYYAHLSGKPGTKVCAVVVR